MSLARGARMHYLVEPGSNDLTTAGLGRLVPDLLQRDVYLCGPPPMADAARKSLRQAGLPDEQLHEERFTW